MKRNSHCQLFTPFCLFCLFYLFSPALRGQDVIRLQPLEAASNTRAFNSHFSKYTLGRMDKSAISALLQSKPSFDSLRIEIEDQAYVFSLQPRDVRGDNYQLRTIGSGGEEVLPMSPNKTFYGLNWDGHHPVCITADETFFMAMIMTDDGPIYIESASLIDATLPEDAFVIFNEKDLKKTVEGAVCGSTASSNHDEHATHDKDTTSNRSMIPCIINDYAIANDHSMFVKYGSVARVAVQNLAVINLVNTNYNDEFDFEVWHRVIEIVVITSANANPWYSGTDYYQLLNSFTAWAPNGFFTDHDGGSLWTNRTLNSGVVGLAWVDQVCGDSAYNILADYIPNFASLRVLQSHELGHNYGYTHDAEDFYIMSPYVNGSNLWSAASQDIINDRLANDGYCLSSCPPASGGRVGIGTTSPHPTAILDISSTTKGLLIPRMTSMERNKIYQPADGLMIYDTGTKSIWLFNATGWTEIHDRKSIPLNNANMMTLGMPGNVGIGVPEAYNKLDIALQPRTAEFSNSHASGLPLYITGTSTDCVMEMRTLDGEQGIGMNKSGIYAAGLLNNANLSLTAKGVGYLAFNAGFAERMRITYDGKVGIGTTAPQCELQLSNIQANRKLLLFASANNDHQYYGFGINAGVLRYQTDSYNADHVFYSAVSGSSSKELMRIDGEGNVSINNGTPDASAIFEVKSTTKGVLIPRMTTAERTAIAMPVNGLLVFDNTTSSFWYRSASAWVELADNLDQEVFRNGPDKIYAALTDSMGIGTNNPATKLEVKTNLNNYGISHTDGTVKLATWIGAGGEIGTRSNHSLFLFANDGLNQFQLAPNGYVSINKPAPTNRLDIAHGNVRTGSHATDKPLYVTGNFGDTGNGVEFRHFDGTQGIGLSKGIVYATGSWLDVNLRLASQGPNALVSIITNGIDRVIVAPDGNVGIGVATPRSPLHLHHSALQRKIILSQQPADNNDHQFYGFGVNGGILRYQVPATTDAHVFYAGTSAGGSNELLRIRGNGNVVVAGAVEVESFAAPAFQNGFSSFNAGFAPAGYYKDKMGRVHLRGMVNTPASPNGVIMFTLPAGYRPTTGAVVMMTVSNNVIARVDVQANGNVLCNIGAGASWISLDNLSFKAE